MKLYGMHGEFKIAVETGKTDDYTLDQFVSMITDAKIERQNLIILDDFGLQPLDNQNRIALLEIIEDRHNSGSIIVTSQIPVKGWYEIIGEKTIADAILDRLIHQSHRIELEGESMRRKRKKINEENM